MPNSDAQSLDPSPDEIDQEKNIATCRYFLNGASRDRTGDLLLAKKPASAGEMGKRSVLGAQVSAGNGSPRLWAVISSLR
jgi:hypothetical protein